MSLLTIAADIPNIDGVLKSVEKAGRGDLPYTKEAVHSALVDTVQRTWIEYASGAQVTYSGGTFHVNTVTGDYVRSIQEGLRMLDGLTGEVFSTSGHGALVENGIKPFNQKEGLLASPKAKTSKSGSRYITVPFRHGTPGAVTMPSMPQRIYDQAKTLGYSRRNNFLTALFTGRKYSWGGRLQKTSEGQRSHTAPHPGKGYTWKTGQYSGMVKMGRDNHSQYMTFRRVSTNSDPASWQFPGVQPRPIREAVIENTREEVLQLIRNGFEMDLYFMGLGGN
jgi:hypothetical protein